MLVMVGLSTWLWFGLPWLWFGFFAWYTRLGEICATLVGYCSTSGIILSVKVKVLESGLCAYGWVTILLYCL
jgi:hypothetical protein